jgi:hypothetical protein
MRGLNLRNVGFVGSLGGAAPVPAVYQTDLFINTPEADGTTVTTTIGNNAFAGRFPASWTATASATAAGGGLVTATGAPSNDYDIDYGSGTVTVDNTVGGWRVDCSQNNNTMQWSLPSGVGIPYFAASFYWSKSAIDVDAMDSVRFTCLDGNYFVLNIQDDRIIAHAIAPGVGGKVTVFDGFQVDTTYFIEMYFVQGAACTMNVYSADKATLHGTNTITPNSTSPVRSFDIGRGDGTAGVGTGTMTVWGLSLSHRYAYVPIGRAFSASNYTAVTALTASDDFAGTGALDGNYSNGRTGWERVSGLATFPTSLTTFATGAVAIRTGENWDADQECSVTIGTWDGWSGGPSVRMSGADGTLTGYGYQPSSGQARGFDRIVDNANTGGSATGTGGARLANTTTTWANGNKMTLGIYGNSTDGSIMLWLAKNDTKTGECVFERGTAPINSGDPAMWGWRPFSSTQGFTDFAAANYVHG